MTLFGLIFTAFNSVHSVGVIWPVCTNIHSISQRFTVWGVICPVWTNIHSVGVVDLFGLIFKAFYSVSQRGGSWPSWTNIHSIAQHSQRKGLYDLFGLIFTAFHSVSQGGRLYDLFGVIFTAFHSMGVVDLLGQCFTVWGVIWPVWTNIHSVSQHGG